MLLGTFEIAIDAKHRLSIPHMLRSKINADADGRSFYFVLGSQPGSLSVYPERLFERLDRERPPLDRLSPRARELADFEYAAGALVDPDAQGRLLVPEWLLGMVEISRQAVLTGARDHMLLWNVSAFKEFSNRMLQEVYSRRHEVQEELRPRPAVLPAVVGGTTQWQEMH